MAYTRSSRSNDEPRRDVGDREFRHGCEALSRTVIDVVRGIATVRNVPWQDAWKEFPHIFDLEVDALQKRIDDAKARRGDSRR